jgi:cell wall-associated NlpC family hydrolase
MNRAADNRSGHNPFDKRLTPARPDIAAASLAGQVEARRFVAGTPMRVVEPAAPLRHAPRPDAALDSEALAGECFTVYDEDEGWAWGQLEGDGYVGYMPRSALGPAGSPATHRVAALRTFLYPGPSIKLPPLGALSLNAGVAIMRSEGDFAITEAGGAIFAAHLVAHDAAARDFVAVAERFLGVAYLWGGKTSLGLDCSALVQLSLGACAVACPRDSDMQEASLGIALPFDGRLGGLRRGDLVFWRGHVGIMRDGATLLHANGHAMAVTSEPLDDAVLRIATKGGGGITAIKRLART